MRAVAQHTTEARALARGWTVLEYRDDGQGVVLECMECGARAERNARLLGVISCLHPAADEVRPYEDDIPCRLLVHRFGAMTLDEIGQAMGVTRERIRQIEAKALERLRKRVLQAGWSEDDVRELLAHLAQRQQPGEAWESARAAAVSPGRVVARHAGETGSPASGVRRLTPPAPPAPERTEDTMAEKTCAQCEKTFEGERAARYCSDDCREQAREARKATKPKKRRASKKRTSKADAGAAMGVGRMTRFEAVGNGATSSRSARKPSRAATETAKTMRTIEQMGKPHGPRALLEMAGYEVQEVVVPAGVALLVGGGAS